MAYRLVHDDPAEVVELGRVLHRFREEVGDVVGSADEGHVELERLDLVADEEVTALHVLHFVVVLWVVGRVTRGLAVGGERRRAVGR